MVQRITIRDPSGTAVETVDEGSPEHVRAATTPGWSFAPVDDDELRGHELPSRRLTAAGKPQPPLAGKRRSTAVRRNVAPLVGGTRKGAKPTIESHPAPGDVQT